MGSGDVQDSATMIGMRARQRSPIMLASKKRSHPGAAFPARISEGSAGMPIQFLARR